MRMNVSRTYIVENAMILYVKMLHKSAKVEIIPPTPQQDLSDNHYGDVIGFM